MTTTDVAVRSSAALTEKMEWSRAMAPGNLLPAQYRGNPANLLFAVEYADALGIERINAITSIHVIEGKPSASAELIAGLVRRAGHRLRITGDDTKAVAQIIRADDPEFTYESTWDIPRAQRAGLAGKAVWKNYPAAMLRSRAITEVARMGASDALLGVVYTPEELGAEVGVDGLPTRPQPLAAAPVTASEILDDAAEDIQDADVVDEPTVVEPMTTAQNRKIHALFRDLGIDDDARQRAGMSKALQRDVASRKDLTKDEAGFIIESLEHRLAQQQAAPQPADDVEWPPVAEVGGAA